MKIYYCSIIIACLLLAACGSESVSRKEEKPDVHPGMTKGKAIFVANCTQCHKLNEKGVGPALTGTMQRWNNDTARIRKFIQNSEEAISSGDPRAKAVYAEYNEMPMTPMPHLTDADVNELIDYINKGVE